MTIYFASTKSKAQFKTARTPEMDQLITETFGIDPALLVEQTGMNVERIKSYQRRLGLRKFTSPNASRRKGKKQNEHSQSND